MGKIKLSGVSKSELETLRAEGAKLGLSFDAYARLQLAPGTDRGATARLIRSRQTQIAKHDSAELIRADRDAE